MDKRDRSELFKERVQSAMTMRGLSKSALSRRTGTNRSTISLLFDTDDARLPNAQLAAECALALGVSCDWLLGLTDRPERAADIVSASMQVTAAERAAADEQVIEWHHEADGYKIRHVPATLPDMLKTQEFLAWEYEAFLGKTPDQATVAMNDRMNWLRTSASDYEIAMSADELRALASCTGYYEGLDPDLARAQLRRLAEQCNTLYPSLRLYLFDAKRLFSAPITVFGPLMAAVYVGDCYLAFRESTRVKSLTRHFDQLVRQASVDSRHVADWIDTLKIRA